MFIGPQAALYIGCNYCMLNTVGYFKAVNQMNASLDGILTFLVKQLFEPTAMLKWSVSDKAEWKIKRSLCHDFMDDWNSLGGHCYKYKEFARVILFLCKQNGVCRLRLF